MPFAQVNGTELFHLEAGKGLPCLVMHGGLGVDHSQFREGLDPLGDVLRLDYDHRGNGRSGRPPIETLTLAQLAADADALRAHLGLERVAVLGHSYGGCLALRYALCYPRRLSHLLLVGTTAAWDYADEIIGELQRRAAGREVLTAFLDVAADDAEFARRQKLVAATLGFHAFDPGRVERLFRGSEMVAFERSGHYPFVEEAEAFRDAVRDWLVRAANPESHSSLPRGAS